MYAQKAVLEFLARWMITKAGLLYTSTYSHGRMIDKDLCLIIKCLEICGNIPTHNKLRPKSA
uniref:Uncharacterized protein n=1 Tax=Coccidioides posadasii RMSCC 3488 TaxID=454284 RepID=A0A0J6FBC4_COCPO|nr:hypothetical protein CPAG_03882 [Coccidioides posadasii RMSCC 3488]